MDWRMKVLRLLGVLEVVSGLTVGALNVPATIHFFIWRFSVFHIGFFALSLLHTVVGITALLAATSSASHSAKRRQYPIHFMGTIIGVGYSLIFFSTLAFEYDTVSFPKSALDVARKTNILTRSNEWYIQAIYTALQVVWLVSTGCLCCSGGIVLCAWKGSVHQELGVPLCLQSYTLPGTRYSRTGCSESSIVLSSFGGSKVSLGVEKERCCKTDSTKLAADAPSSGEGCSFIEA